MINEILILGFSLLGIIALLLAFVFKMIAWRLKDFTVVLPLYGDDKEIYHTIYDIRSFFEFCGIEEKCTVVIDNRGASEEFCNNILNYYEKYNFLKIANSSNIIK